MCGIAGYSTLAAGRPACPDYLDSMIAALAHRGPDHTGTAVMDEVLLANARLSILDIAGGDQPIYNEDRSLCVVFNGELYNSPELRRELERKGHVFSTHTDTEVLVHLYEEEGDALCVRLNGMFAFALFDSREQRLLLARDRFGVKPLYYFHKDNELVFGSEIKALRHHPAFDAALSPEGLSVFLGLFYIPDPWSIYRNVRKLPGHLMVHDRGGLRLERYFDLGYASKQRMTRREAEDEAARLIQQAVQRQLLSDVPVGVLLSGGLDSRSMLMAATRQEQGIRSYTISFDEVIYDEGCVAAKIAAACGSPHSSMTFTLDEFVRTHAERQKHLDEPYALWCNTATAALARHIHAHGCKVVLSGEGGDEVFNGYPTVHALNAYRLYRRLPRWLRQKAISPAVARIPAGQGRLPLAFMLKSFVEADHQDLVRTFFGFKEVLRFEVWQDLLTPEAYAMVGELDPAMAFTQYSKEIEGLHLIDALSYLDFKVFLPGCSFAGNDNAYMSASVEARVPMMDNDLVDFGCALPVDVRFHPLRPKIVLKRALERHYPMPPEAGVGRYRKQGFEIPGDLWFGDPRFAGLVDEALSPVRLARGGFFRPEAVARILDEQRRGVDNHERRIQAIMSLSLFLDSL